MRALVPDPNTVQPMEYRERAGFLWWPKTLRRVSGPGWVHERRWLEWGRWLEIRRDTPWVR